MDFIRKFIEQRISLATGADVRIGKFSFSPLSGSVEVRDLLVGTFLAVRKIEAKIAVARALKQEIVVRSLAIEGPVLTIRRGADGKLNLPPRPARNKSPDSKEAKKSWEFEANKVLLVGGKISFEDAGAYRISLDNLTGSVSMRSPTEGEFVFAADSLGRRDVAVELGESRLLGRFGGGMNFSLTAGTLLDLSVGSPTTDMARWEGELNLARSLATLLALLPPAVRLPISTASGEARLTAAGHFERSKATFQMNKFELRTGPVTVR